MTLTSTLFVVFTAFALGIYYLLPRRAQNLWLLLVSYAFVVSWDWRFAIVLGIITASNFLVSQQLRLNDQVRRGLLWAGIGINVFALILFRVANFFLPELETLLSQLGVNTQVGGLQILIPLGLSYYVLQAISNLIDVSRGQMQAEPDFVNFALYLAYFPKIIAGPIERPRPFLSKLSQSRVVDNMMLSRSALLILVGIVRKLFLADILAAAILPDVFTTPAIYTPLELIGWLVIYAFALYNDFAGYTNIARGVSGLFGIELSANFRAPYFARNFTEFWSRWHITLSEWLRDYIYFPLSRLLSRRNPSRRNFANLILPPLITMLVSGMWHGLSLHMIVWGGLHGLYQVLERVLAMRRAVISPQNQPVWRQGLSMGIVFILVILAWVPFRWELPAAWDFWVSLLNWSSVTIRYRRLFFVIPFLLASLLIDYLQYHKEDEFIFLRWPRLAQATCIAVILLLAFIATGGDFDQPFIYQAF